MSSVVVNDTYVTGNTMKVQYQVSNEGSGEPFERFWQDQVVRVYSLCVTNPLSANVHIHTCNNNSIYIILFMRTYAYSTLFIIFNSG